MGGGCHWCTEAVFQCLKGVENVVQGYALVEAPNIFSEAIIIEFDPSIITLQDLIEIHLHTHKSTSQHSMRESYVSAVYVFSEIQQKQAIKAIQEFQKDFKEKIITKVLNFKGFKASREEIQNYYLKNPSKPFCERYIHPKLELLRTKFSNHLISEESAQ
ncbi:MAG: peptide-methionine (S)-S-oxide reductase [Patiriisocius sp.]|uniref:peptide-methionine (S)-S-oxide reductase n=1 Tax=Patiriisocius sp. TaxID=2822396 RepID=UPI003EF7650D